MVPRIFVSCSGCSFNRVSIISTCSTHGKRRRFKWQKILQRWKVFFLEGIYEYIHPLKFQKLAIGGFWINGFFVFFWFIFTQPDFSLHSMVFLRFFLGRFWVGVGWDISLGQFLSFCIFWVLGPFLALFWFQWPFGHFETISELWVN